MCDLRLLGLVTGCFQNDQKPEKRQKTVGKSQGCVFIPIVDQNAKKTHPASLRLENTAINTAINTANPNFPLTVAAIRELDENLLVLSSEKKNGIRLLSCGESFKRLLEKNKGYLASARILAFTKIPLCSRNPSVAVTPHS